MIENIFKRTSVALMEKVLNISGARQRVIASNISNAMTQGYISRDVDFEKSLAKAVDRAGLKGKMENHRHIPIGGTSGGRKPVVITKKGEKSDIDKEMANSAENQLLYSAAARIVSGNFRSLRGCIRGRF